MKKPSPFYLTIDGNEAIYWCYLLVGMFCQQPLFGTLTKTCNTQLCSSLPDLILRVEITAFHIQNHQILFLSCYKGDF